VPDDALRLDRWLWFTRFYKTRTAATAAVQGGHVRINDERARAATRVRVGDEILLVRQQLTYEFTVVDMPVRRGPATEARACYQEAPESIERRKQMVADLKSDRQQMPMTRGKPDKRTRRQLRNRNRGNRR